jgi:hypothetical protein
LPQPLLVPPVPRVEHHDIGARASMAASWSADCTRPGGRPRRTRYGERKCSTVQLWSRKRNDRNPLCLVMGFPFSSYTDEPPSTSATAAESMDSHWLRPIESPTNTSRRFRSVSSSRAACRTPPPPGVLAVRPAVLGAPEPGVDERARLVLVQRVVPRVVAHPLAFHGHASEVVVAAVPTAPLFVVVVVASTSAEEKAKMSRESTQAPHTTMSRPAGGLPLLRALAMSIASCFRRSRPAARRTCVRKRLLVFFGVAVPVRWTAVSWITREKQGVDDGRIGRRVVGE